MDDLAEKMDRLEEGFEVMAVRLKKLNGSLGPMVERLEGEGRRREAGGMWEQTGEGGGKGSRGRKGGVGVRKPGEGNGDRDEVG